MVAAAAPLWFTSLAGLGAVYLSVVFLRLLPYLTLYLLPPKDLRRCYGSWAVITGPTTGLGRSMAMELARRGFNLVLLDLNPGNLREVSETIRRSHGVETRTVVFDLSLVGTGEGDAAMRRLREAVEGVGDVGMLVNNAAVAKPGALYFHEADVERLVTMIRVNAMALTEVTAAVLPGMVKRRRGAIVNVGSGSTVAVPSFPLYTVYSSSKRYVEELSRNLYVEYRSKGIDVQLQVPFYVHTNMLSAAVKARMLLPAFVATADAYTRAAARWIGHGHIAVPDAGQQLQWLLAAFVPDFAHNSYRLRKHLQHRAILWNLN
ncbi:very-long-chain 3-oxoacyl-CoA reductase 1-like [Oryza brachyantha]|uniref:very-long-chain 3-oxoacyl-CoA reductase 1-like n=1 Tax=Oryza brachyantha TaxID=4533 RepID=UPI001ADC6E78|nr:very-long-chain 3-oxoacyl-CoA reductase 1-like [Oryza brachyantha]